MVEGCHTGKNFQLQNVASWILSLLLRNGRVGRKATYKNATHGALTWHFSGPARKNTRPAAGLALCLHLRLLFLVTRNFFCAWWFFVFFLWTVVHDERLVLSFQMSKRTITTVVSYPVRHTWKKRSNRKYTGKIPSPHPSSAHKRPAAALSRQGFISPKIDWVSQSKFSAVRSYCAPWVPKIVVVRPGARALTYSICV